MVLSILQEKDTSMVKFCYQNLLNKKGNRIIIAHLSKLVRQFYRFSSHVYISLSPRGSYLIMVNTGKLIAVPRNKRQEITVECP